ncbi:reverse transcriptase-like protein [Bhargavaea beijingensis]|uniref:reverse transcriptase-like protein n=1 Tax=Bhargavaea beijingensis TaxID=426756 RepID=UPI002224F057|nr:reverse transcriptase-like protein [Bhargavaea beijingensis]MCW1928139.1 reverse transcriptase-like protein [Bhargavaea beijingensis]
MLEVYVDGAAAGNPGPAGIGVLIRGEGHEVRVSEPLEDLDNHTAEFRAFVRGVEEAAKLTSGLVSVRSDSKAVVSAVEKRYAKNPVHMDMLERALRIADGFDFFFIKWIPDSQNRAADALARAAIRRK